MNKTTSHNNHKIYYSNYPIFVKYIVAIVTGLCTLLLSQFSLSVSLAGLNISFPWVLIFPLIISIGYGSIFGLVAGFAGAALYPLFLWPQEGFANFITIIIFLYLFYTIGKLMSPDRKQNNQPLITRILIIFGIVVVSYSAAYLILYNPLLSLNKYWFGESIVKLPQDVLLAFTIKDSINFLYLLILADLMLKLPIVRKILGIPSGYEMKENHKIFGIAAITTLVMFLGFILLDYFLIKEPGIEREYRILVIIIMLLTGAISARILIRMFEHRLLAEWKLQKSENRFRMISEQANDLISLHRIDGVIEYISPSVEKILNFKPEDIIGKNINDFLHPDEKQKFSENLSEILKTKTIKNSVHRAQHQNGMYIWMETNGRLLLEQEGQSPIIQIVSRDISDRYKVQKALKENEETLSSIFNNAPFIMMLVDKNMCIAKINSNQLPGTNDSVSLIGKTICEVFNCTIRHIKNQNEKNETCEKCIIHKLFTESFHSNKSFSKVEGQIFNEHRDKKYEIRTVLASSSVLYKSSEKHVLMTIDDITPRKKMEEQLKFSKQKAEESDRLKSAFLANISHEIRTPMNGILGFAQMLRSQSKPGVKESKYIDVILENSDRLMMLVNDLLDISKIESGQLQFEFKLTHLHQMFDDLYMLFAPQAKKQGITFEVNQTAGEEATLITDGERLRQVLSNLLHNAIKFTEAGRVIFGFEMKKNDWIVIYVTDTGLGIPEHEQENIFERFRQIDYEFAKLKGGTGLGLALSKQIIEHLGGEIQVESKEGFGSTFRILIPRKPLDYQEE